MFSALVAGYSSSDEDEEATETKETPAQDSGQHIEPAKKEAEKPVVPKRKLPSAAAMMASTTSWARGDEPAEMDKSSDKLGTKYHHVPPPKGVRAEDGVMGGGADYIKPITGHSLDANKVYEGHRQLSTKSKPGTGLIPPQLRGRKNVSTEDVGSWTAEKKSKSKQ